MASVVDGSLIQTAIQSKAPAVIQKQNSLEYTATTTLLEKISRAAHITIGAGALYGVYALATGGSGLALYVGYVSMAVVARKIVAVVAGLIIFPAWTKSKKNLAMMAADGRDVLQNKGFTVQHITFYKSGVSYRGVLVSNPENGNKWTMHALGNFGAFEEIFDMEALRYAKEFQSNSLFINGPAVGQSGGLPTEYSCGAGFEAGLSFLEEEVKATHILMTGQSLGGGNLGEAVLNHKFTLEKMSRIRYMMVSDRTFSKITSLVGKLIGSPVEYLLRAVGFELDTIGGAKRLSELCIPHVIIQSKDKHDRIINDGASLATAIRQDLTLNNKMILEDKIGHNEPLSWYPKIYDPLQAEIKKFFAS